MTHPDHVVPLEQRPSILRVEPLYGLTAGLTQRPLQKAIAAALERAPALAEWQDPAFLARNRWAGWKAVAGARARAGGREPISRRRSRRARGSPSTSCWPTSSRSRWSATTTARLAAASTLGDGRLRRSALAALPFALTDSQTARDRGDRGRHGQAGAHAAAAAGRRRQRQDRGRPARHADRGRGGRAGGADGADRAPGPPAPRDHRAACRGRRRARWRC